MRKDWRLPHGWESVRLGSVADIQTGIAKGARKALRPVELPYLRVANVHAGTLQLDEIKTITVDATEVARYSLRDGDVLMTEGGDFDKLGRGTVWRGEIAPCLHQNHVFAVRPHLDRLAPEYLSLVSESGHGRKYFQLSSKQSTNLASINSTQLRAFPIALPPRSVQDRIVGTAAEFDRATVTVVSLISAKRRLKRALTQRLCLTPPVSTEVYRVGQVATETSARAGSGPIRVLSCTKHDGLVDSVGYFGRKVHSEDTSGYRLVRRGQLAYATNHIEEGSIGLLEDYDEGAVSPMYTVFECGPLANPAYLFAMLKTEQYRKRFAALTSGSVNRRGGLRWDSFSKIHVALPAIAWQAQSVRALTALDREITQLATAFTALRLQKRGVMQKLLSGEIELPDGSTAPGAPAPEAESAP